MQSSFEGILVVKTEHRGVSAANNSKLSCINVAKHINFVLVLIILCIGTFMLSSCGFSLRGKNGNFKFPFDKVSLDCTNTAICKNLQTAIITESLATFESKPAHADVIIRIINEQTARDPQSFNAYGRISAYILTYQAEAQLLNNRHEQLGENITILQRLVMQYNDTTILADTTEEQNFWDQLHEMATNQLIHKIVYFRALQVLKQKKPKYATESK